MKKGVKYVLLIMFVFLMPLLWMSCISANPIKTGQIIKTNIYAIKNSLNNIFFIKTDSGYIMIDAARNIKKFEASLIESNINITDVKWILLTHSDYDHVAALNLFPNAEIYIGEDELPLINGTVKRSRSGGNKMPDGFDISKLILLSNNQELLFDGIKTECIKAPGHTIGSMLFLVDDQYLFTGDAFKIKNGKISVHPYSMDSEQSEKTIEQMKEIINKSTIVLTGHYGIHYNL